MYHAIYLVESFEKLKQLKNRILQVFKNISAADRQGQNKERQNN